MIQFSRKKHVEAFNLMSQTDNPEPSKATHAIWIFAARHDIYNNHINCIARSINFKALATTQVYANCDFEDDYLRIKAGLEMGAKLTAKRSGKIIADLNEEDYKLHAPLIIYNGSSEQNDAFKEAIEKGLGMISLPNYHPDKIVIIPLSKDKIHTGGQFDSLAEHINIDSRLHGLNKDNAEIVCVSSTYHLRRIQMLFHSKMFKNPFSSKAKITLWGTDRKFEHPCALTDIEGELSRIEMYSKSDDIGDPCEANWYSISSLKNWTPLRLTMGSHDSSSRMSHVNIDSKKANTLK